MKHIYSKLLISSLIASSGIMTANAVYRPMENIDLTNYRYQIESRNAFSSKRQTRIDQINGKMFAEELSEFKSAQRANTKKSVQAAEILGPCDYIADLDAPNGELWFYTASFEYEEIPPHDDIAYTDRILREYEFTIYNTNNEIVGSIKDRMDYRENEVRTPMCELAPVITRNFFNDTDDIEVVVGLAVNVQGQSNAYRSIVYSIDGAKDANGYDKPIHVIESLIGDAIEGPRTHDGKDNYYITFTDDIDASDILDQDEDISFWDYLCANSLRITVYGSARGASAPQKLLEKDVNLIKLPGDQQNSPFFISLIHNGNVYFVQSEYAEPFYERYDSPADELTMRNDNKLIVNFYKAGENSIKLDYVTEISFSKDPVDEVLASYYCVGNMRYKNDIIFDNYDTPEGRAALIVTKDNYMAGGDDSYISSYYVYNHDGTRRNIIFENCENTMPLSDIEGAEPQQLFITADGYNYGFSFVDLISCKRVNYFTNDFYIDEYEDSEPIYANLDRMGKDGDYKYAIELRYPTIDDNDNDIMRIMWLDKRANFERIDEVNMGKGVLYAQCFINDRSLSPHFYDSDDVYEYMILIKRGTANSGTQEELLVGKVRCEEYPDGKDLLYIKPDEIKGSLKSIIAEPGTGDKQDRLTIAFYNKTTQQSLIEFYTLPFDNGAGVDNIVNDITTDGNITIQNNTIIADGEILVYTIAGSPVASGNGTLATDNLSKGLYIVTANNSAIKLLIK